MLPPALFFLKIALAIWVCVCVWSHTNFSIICFIVLKKNAKKNAIGILIEMKIDSVDCFGTMAILTILIFPIHEHWISYICIFFNSFYAFLSPLKLY